MEVEINRRERVPDVDWRQRYWDATQALGELRDRLYEAEKLLIERTAILHRAVKVFPNDDGWLHEAQSLFDGSTPSGGDKP